MTRLHWWMSLTLGWFKKHLQKLISDSLNPKIGMVEVFGASSVTWSVTSHQTDAQRDKIVTKCKNLFHLISWTLECSFRVEFKFLNPCRKWLVSRFHMFIQTTAIPSSTAILILWCWCAGRNKVPWPALMNGPQPSKDPRNTSRTAWIILKNENSVRKEHLLCSFYKSPVKAVGWASSQILVDRNCYCVVIVWQKKTVLWNPYRCSLAQRALCLERSVHVLFCCVSTNVGATCGTTRRCQLSSCQTRGPSTEGLISIECVVLTVQI